MRVLKASTAIIRSDVLFDAAGKCVAVQTLQSEDENDLSKSAGAHENKTLVVP
jgi:hypothetical protein